MSKKFTAEIEMEVDSDSDDEQEIKLEIIEALCDREIYGKCSIKITDINTLISD